MPTPDASMRLTPTQQAVLVVLMGEAREITNTEFRQLVGFALDGEHRRGLEGQGYIESRKVGRVYAFQLTEKGWALCKRLHAVQVDTKGSRAARAIPNLLSNLSRGLHRHRISHAELFAHTETQMPADGPAGPAADSFATAGPAADGFATAGPAAAAGATTTAGLPDIQARIRAAYPQLPKGPGGWVRLADLRDHLAGLGRGDGRATGQGGAWVADLDRVSVDAALRAMAREPGVRLIPVADSASLHERDRAAALRIGDDDNHALWIEAA